MSSNWPKAKLGEYSLKIGSGSTPRGGSSVYLDSGNTSLIRSQNIYNDSFHPDGLVYISDEEAERLRGVSVEEDDVLLNITGDSVARVCMAPKKYLPARVNQHVAIIRVKKEEFDPRFVRYHLVSPSSQEYLLTIAGSGATRNALTKGMIEALEVPKPDIEIQRSIADIVSSLDEKIELNLQINQTLEQMAQAIFKSWFVDFDPVRAKMEGRDTGLPNHISDLFPDELMESELGLVPKGWGVKTFGDVAQCFDSKRIPLSKREREAKKPGYIPYYGATSIMDFVNEWIFDGVYLLLGEDGSVIKEDGTPFIQYIWGKSWVNNHAHVLQGKNGISTEHLMLFIQGQNIAAYITGAVQLKLNQGNMNSIPFIKATNEINKAFDSVIQPLYEMWRQKSEEIAFLTETRDSLLPKLLSGEIGVERFDIKECVNA